MTESDSKTELGLWPRLITAAWFAGAALLPVLFFFIKFGGLWETGTLNVSFGMLIVFGEVPVALAALFGFTLGARIIDPVLPFSFLRGALRGMVVAFLSYISFIAVYLIASELSTPGPSIGIALFVITVGTAIMLIPVAVSGALAGFLLCIVANQTGTWDWLLHLPRVTTTKMYVLINIAAVLALLNCALAVYTFGRQ